MPPPKWNKFTNNKTGKLKKIPTVASPAPVASTEPTAEENQQQLELEICWCVQQLETSLNNRNLTQKQVEDINKSIRILKSGTQPTIKKRQLMRNNFGDYRSKMQEEERKMGAAIGRVQFQATPAAALKSQFLRKAIIKPSGEDFKFNFKVEELSLNDNAKDPVESTAESIPRLNTFFGQPTGNEFKFNFGN